MLPTDPKARKAIPIFSGFMKYFPKAIAAVAQLSAIANEQHNPGTPVHWDKDKSSDELDALARHLDEIAAGVVYDDDRVLMATKVAWRGVANLERLLDSGVAPIQPEGVDRYGKPLPAKTAIERLGECRPACECFRCRNLRGIPIITRC